VRCGLTTPYPFSSLAPRYQLVLRSPPRTWVSFPAPDAGGPPVLLRTHVHMDEPRTPPLSPVPRAPAPTWGSPDSSHPRSRILYQALSSCTTTEMSREVTTVMVVLLLYSATLHLPHPPLAFSLRPYRTRASASAAAHLWTGRDGQDMCRGARTRRRGYGLPEKTPGRVIFPRSQQFQ
jgi:hypothetical protein